MPTPTLQWSENVQPAEVRTGEELDQLLNGLAATSEAKEFPISVRLDAHGCWVDILLGLQESFVYVDEISPTRYYITVGDPHAEGTVNFHMFGQHHTEFESRCLIPLAAARRVFREFYDTGRRSSSVEWEENCY